MTTPIGFVLAMEADIRAGTYAQGLIRPIVRDNLLRNYKQLRAACQRGDRDEMVRINHLIVAALEHERGLIVEELDELYTLMLDHTLGAA